MSQYSCFLIDTGILVAFFNRGDKYHSQVYPLLKDSTAVMVTTVACITETMHLLPRNWKVQNDLLLMVSQGIIECKHLQSVDFARIAELNIQYADLPGDFADLALIVISERLGIEAVATLDSDFDVYRRYQKHSFERVFRPQ